MREAARGKSVCLQRSAGVAPEVNLRITLHTGTSEGFTVVFKPRANVIKSPK